MLGVGQHGECFSIDRKTQYLIRMHSSGSINYRLRAIYNAYSPCLRAGDCCQINAMASLWVNVSWGASRWYSLVVCVWPGSRAKGRGIVHGQAACGGWFGEGIGQQLAATVAGVSTKGDSAGISRISARPVFTDRLSGSVGGAFVL